MVSPCGCRRESRLGEAPGHASAWESTVSKSFCPAWVRVGLLPAFISLTTAAAGIAAPITLQQVPLAPLKTLSPATPNASNPVAHQGRPGGLNQQIRPASSRAKFVAEPERQGS